MVNWMLPLKYYHICFRKNFSCETFFRLLKGKRAASSLSFCNRLYNFFLFIGNACFWGRSLSNSWSKYDLYLWKLLEQWLTLLRLYQLWLLRFTWKMLQVVCAELAQACSLLSICSEWEHGEPRLTTGLRNRRRVWKLRGGNKAIRRTQKRKVSGRRGLWRNGKGQTISNYFLMFPNQPFHLKEQDGCQADIFTLSMFYLNLIGNPYSSVLSFLNRKVDTKSSRGEAY